MLSMSFQTNFTLFSQRLLGAIAQVAEEQEMKKGISNIMVQPHLR